MATPFKYLPARGRVYLPELIEKIDKMRSREERKAILLEYVARDQHHAALLKGFVECCLHPGVVFELPSGEPPYTPGVYPDYDLANTNLFNAIKKVPLIARCPNMIQNKIKRESIFIQTLEALHPKEAALMVAMVNKTFPSTRGFTVNLITEVFPNWIPADSPK